MFSYPLVRTLKSNTRFLLFLLLVFTCLSFNTSHTQSAEELSWTEQNDNSTFEQPSVSEETASIDMDGILSQEK